MKNLGNPWDQRNTEDEMVADGTLAGFESYIQQVSEVNQYAGNLEITALASTMDRPITVVQAEGPVHTFNSSGANRGIYLFYGSSHYELLECTAEAKSSQRVVQTQKKALGSRASGQAAGSIGGLTRRSFVTSKGQKKQHSPATKAMTAKDSIGALKVGSLPAAQPSVGGLTRKTLVLKPSKQGHKSLASGSFCGDRDSATKSSRSKGLSAVPSKQLVKSFSDGIALKGNRRDPKDIWTCPHEGCGVTFRKGEKQRSLTSLRAAHLAKFHPDIPRSKNDHMREYAPPVLASASIPESERDWSCPWCPAGLPFLPKSDKTKAVTHHYATKHPKRDTSAGKSCWNFFQCKQRLGSASSAQASLWERLAQAPDIRLALSQAWGCTVEEATAWTSSGSAAWRKSADLKGHEFQEFKVDWSKCPLKGKTNRGKMITCVNCRVIRCTPGVLTPCKGSDSVPHKGTVATWRKLKGSEVQKQLLRLWNISLKDANKFFNKKPMPRQKNFQPDLTSHGDVEPNPGPLSLQVLCCNVRTSTGAWSLLNHSRTDDPHSFLVLCLQETKFNHGEFEAFRRHAHRLHQGTRWESDREIDWYAICADSGAGVLKALEVHVSDHKVLSCDFKFKDRNTKVGYLTRGPSWVLPQGLNRDQWKKLLQDNWARLPSAAQFLERLLSSDLQGTVEDDWNQFLQVLDDLHREAFWELSQTSEDSRISCDAAARCRNTVVKGHPPARKERNTKRCNAKVNETDMKLVKCRKRVARIYELIRLTKEQVSGSELSAGSQHVAARANLVRRLRLESQPPLREQLSLLRRAKAELQAMETQGRDDRLSGWRQQFNSDVKFAGKWLKSSGSTMGIQIKDGDGTSRSPQEAAEKIHKYWDQFWQQLKAETPPTEQITEQLLQNTVSLPEERFIIPSVQELVSVAASMRGSGGGDAWVGSELSCLPPEAWQMYRILVERWLAAGRVPEAVKAARTVFLPKEHKVIEGVLQAG
ncbi:unnamed protein product, partial [Cladocopium goreaui]